MGNCWMPISMDASKSRMLGWKAQRTNACCCPPHNGHKSFQKRQKKKRYEDRALCTINVLKVACFGLPDTKGWGQKFPWISKVPPYNCLCRKGQKHATFRTFIAHSEPVVVSCLLVLWCLSFVLFWYYPEKKFPEKRNFLYKCNNRLGQLSRFFIYLF